MEMGGPFARAQAYANDVRSPTQRIAIIGDSIAQQNTGSNVAGSKYKYAKGIVAWANAYLGQPWVMDPSDNFAAYGTSNSAIISTQLPSLAASYNAGTKYSRVFISAGTNDTGAGRDISTVKAEFTTIYNFIRSIGAIPVQLAILPRGTDGSMTNAKRQNQELNSWFTLLDRQGLIEHCSYSDMVADNSTAYGNALTTMMGDSGTVNLHPNSLGAAHLGKKLADFYTLRGMSRTPRYATQQSDVMDRTYNKYGVAFKNANPLMQGGTTAPTGMSTSGGTWSKVNRTLSNGQVRTDCQCVLAATATHYLYDDWVASGQWGATELQPGDQVEASCHIEITSGVGIYALQLMLVESNGVNTTEAYDLQYDSSSVIPDGNHVLHLRTPPLTIRAYGGSGNASIFAKAEIRTSSGSGTAVVKAFEVRRVA